MAQSGLNQLDFARKAGVGQSSVSNWVSNLRSTVDDRLVAPNAGNIMVLAQHLLNPQTGQPFTPSQLFAICSGENRLTEDQLQEIAFVPTLIEQESRKSPQDSKAKAVSRHSSSITQKYWDEFVIPNVSRMLDVYGDLQTDGTTSFQSRDYIYRRAASGDVEILPKSDRPPLSPSNLTQKDVTVLNAIADKMQAITSDYSTLKSQKQSIKRPRGLKL
ncbi:helix-turn-helix domain-containing protein [Lyngbya confervoides]|uniref:Helix-turn-helix domain-containing protein n=1 Tax=Lyngbya confervoides BDU141951 TaxID=1574623 RepID=A0ABD4T951_9CYAN|nr:helix-turn-helix transcriptional regulator [Lyngbya confervoides]MCM1985102.1 helix-turn-helix domain-containing protein [Lyngbya confervoides BDU141951]